MITRSLSCAASENLSLRRVNISRGAITRLGMAAKDPSEFATGESRSEDGNTFNNQRIFNRIYPAIVLEFLSKVRPASTVKDCSDFPYAKSVDLRLARSVEWGST